MIIEKFRDCGTTGARYVRRLREDLYAWCESSAADPRYDVAQGTCEADDLPADIRAVCDAYHGSGYACEWPL